MARRSRKAAEEAVEEEPAVEAEAPAVAEPLPVPTEVPESHVCPHCGNEDMDGGFDVPEARPGHWVFKCRFCKMYSGQEA